MKKNKIKMVKLRKMNKLFAFTFVFVMFLMPKTASSQIGGQIGSCNEVQVQVVLSTFTARSTENKIIIAQLNYHPW